MGLCLSAPTTETYNEGLRLKSTDYEQASRYFKIAADEGNPEAQVEYALWLISGIGGPRNYFEAAEYCKMAVDQNEPKALLLYHDFLIKGEGVEKNVNKAILLLKKAADIGLAEAQARYALMLHEGKYLNQNMDESISYAKMAIAKRDRLAICFIADLILANTIRFDENIFSLLKNVADSGYSKGQVLYAQYLITKNDFEAALYYAKKAAEQDCAEGALMCSRFYGDGVGTEQNPIEFRKYIEAAAKQNNSEAQALYAYSLIHGIGGNVDYNLASQYCTMAINENDPLATYLYATLLLNGKGVEKNHVEAFKYFKIAADAGLSHAQAMLSSCYMLGNGTNADMEKASFYAEKSAEQNDNLGLVQMALILLQNNDEGTKNQNNARALQYIKTAADNGFTYAQLKLGSLLILPPNGISQDPETSAAYFKLAASKNCDAAYLYGLMLLDGQGIEQDISEGASYIKMAADRGHISAQQKFAECLDKGIEADAYRQLAD